LGTRDLSVRANTIVIAAVTLGFAVVAAARSSIEPLRARVACRRFFALLLTFLFGAASGIFHSTSDGFTVRFSSAACGRFDLRASRLSCRLLLALILAFLIGAAIDYLNISGWVIASFRRAGGLNLRARSRSRSVLASVLALPSRAAFRVSPDLLAPATALMPRASVFHLRAVLGYRTTLVCAALHEALLTLYEVRAKEYKSVCFAACLNWAGLRKRRTFRRSRADGLRGLLLGGLSSYRLGGFRRLIRLSDSISCFAFFEVSADIILLSSSQSGDSRCRLGGFISALEVVSLVSFTTTLFELVTL
jgi:hypothetical protein